MLISYLLTHLNSFFTHLYFPCIYIYNHFGGDVRGDTGTADLKFFKVVLVLEGFAKLHKQSTHFNLDMKVNFNVSQSIHKSLVTIQNFPS